MSEENQNPETATVAAPVLDDPEGIFEEGLPDEVLRIRLDRFEGPFEVLLYLIRAQEIDIFDIPILKITEQYLHFLELMRQENLDIAGEFIVMAATLIQIKSRMVLPAEVDDTEEEEIEEEDPRLELVEKLLEYRKYRDLAVALGDCSQRRADQFGRNVRPVIEPGEEEEEDEDLEVSLYDLLKAIRAMLRYVTEGPIHAILAEGHSIDEKIAFIMQALDERDTVTWSELFHAARSRIEIVCCLLAILELCRMDRIRAHQHQPFGEIRLFARDIDAEPLAAPVE